MSISTIINVLIGLLVFSFIIFFHEFGHFLLAKRNGIFVNEFAVGMGPAFFSFTRNETKYSLRAIPIGGYCMMLGEEEDVDDERSFSRKSVLARLAVVVAGPLFNFILAFILSLVLIGLCGYDRPVIKTVVKDGAAFKAGIKEDDVICAINGGNIYNYREILIFNVVNQDAEPVTLTVLRDGKKQDITFSREKMDDGYKFGFSGGAREKSGVLNTVKFSFYEMRYQIKSVFVSLKALFTRKLGFNKLSGPVGIVSMMNDTINQAKDSANGDSSLAVINIILNMVQFTILISANLGVMNLLPIPALDGGRAVFLIFEGIFKKRIPIEKEALLNTISFILLLGLMVIVLFQDILKIIVK